MTDALRMLPCACCSSRVAPPRYQWKKNADARYHRRHHHGSYAVHSADQYAGCERVNARRDARMPIAGDRHSRNGGALGVQVERSNSRLHGTRNKASNGS